MKQKLTSSVKVCGFHMQMVPEYVHLSLNTTSVDPGKVKPRLHIYHENYATLRQNYTKITINSTYIISNNICITF